MDRPERIEMFARTTAKRLLAVGCMACGAWLTAGAGGAAHAQLRVATWNVTEWGQSSYNPANIRQAGFGTSIFTSFSGRSMTPDILVIQEVSVPAAANTFLSILNGAPGSPGGYALATFVDGIGLDSACYYRTSKVTFLGTSTAVPAPATERNVQRYQFRVAGYTGAGAELNVYSLHLKAGSSGTDAGQRNTEAQAIRNHLETLPAGARFIVAGDFNFYSNSTVSEPAWNELTGSQTNNAGRLFDPINRAGSWNNNSSFAVVHTQAPSVGPSNNWGGMDDRFDFLLINDDLFDGVGMDYWGNPAIPYGSNWNDPNHSYRCWGNDGGFYNGDLQPLSNAMVGPVVGQALRDHFSGVNSPPHLPVFMDVLVPAKASSSVASINFGTVLLGAPASSSVTVSNSASVGLHSRAGDGTGIDALTYTLAASSGFTAPGGTFNDPAGGGGNAHTITMNTATPGIKSGTITIASDDPDAPNLIINVSGTVVVGSVDFDVNNDGLVNTEDLYSWYFLPTDVNGDGSATAADATALRTELRSDERLDVTAGLR